MILLSWLAWMLVSPYIAVFIHETGHYCAAIATRWPVKYVEFGGGRKVRILRWPTDMYIGLDPLQGCVFISITHLRDKPDEVIQRYRTPLAIIAVAGPLASIAAGVCATLMGLHILGLINMFYGMYTWMSSDGKLVKEYLRGDPLRIIVEDD